VGILVHDSDIVQMFLCRSSKLVDIFDSDPDYFTDIPRERRRTYRGEPRKWSDLLVDGATVDDLRAVWQVHQTFAEDTLEGVCRLLGLSFDRAGIGLRYLLRADEGHDLTGFTRLAFRARAQPLIRAGEGPPRLGVGSITPWTTLKAGEPIGSGGNNVSVSARSLGGGARGLRLVVWGSALDDGLVSLTRANLNRHAESGDEIEVVEVDFVQRESGGVRHLDARLPDYEIRPGVATILDLFSSGPRPTMHRLVRAESRAGITAVLKGRAPRPGTGLLHVGFAPLANHDEGQVSFTVEVEVLPADG
jgi:hypothetical protein